MFANSHCNITNQPISKYPLFGFGELKIPDSILCEEAIVYMKTLLEQTRGLDLWSSIYQTDGVVFLKLSRGVPNDQKNGFHSFISLIEDIPDIAKMKVFLSENNDGIAFLRPQPVTTQDDFAKWIEDAKSYFDADYQRVDIRLNHETVDSLTLIAKARDITFDQCVEQMLKEVLNQESLTETAKTTSE